MDVHVRCAGADRGDQFRELCRRNALRGRANDVDGRSLRSHVTAAQRAYAASVHKASRSRFNLAKIWSANLRHNFGG